MRSTTRLAVSFLLMAGASAGAETTDCTAIAALPYKVSVSGVYCLKESLDTPSYAGISIEADDVTIDFNGHAVSGAFWGVTSEASRRNIVVRNGTVRGGGTGIDLSGISGLVVERMRIENMSDAGIRVRGAGSIVRDNVVTGVTNGRNDCCVYGIDVSGALASVSDNKVLDVGAGRTAESAGIHVGFSDGAAIERNIVGNTVKTTTYFPMGVMVLGPDGAKVTVDGNRVSNFGTGIAVVVGQGALLLNNTVANSVRPFFGGVILAGTTNYSF